jgi:hypothetical protein
MQSLRVFNVDRDRSMAPLKIMIIRHAEKPMGAESGVSPTGAVDDADLSVRGWQRAGALARFFYPRDGRFSQPRLASPAAIFAAGSGPGSESKRHIHTVESLSELIGLPIDASFLKHQSRELAQAVLHRSGVVLVSWDHKEIPSLIGWITDHSVTVPAWPQNRYDLVLILDRLVCGWTMTQAPQLLLPGDRYDPLEEPTSVKPPFKGDAKAA